jgi:hypothetical protein
MPVGSGFGAGASFGAVVVIGFPIFNYIYYIKMGNFGNIKFFWPPAV